MGPMLTMQTVHDRLELVSSQENSTVLMPEASTLQSSDQPASPHAKSRPRVGFV